MSSIYVYTHTPSVGSYHASPTTGRATRPNDLSGLSSGGLKFAAQNTTDGQPFNGPKINYVGLESYTSSLPNGGSGVPWRTKPRARVFDFDSS